MDEKEIAAKIKKQCAELSDLTRAAAEMGITVEIYTQRYGESGVVIPRIRKVQEL